MRLRSRLFAALAIVGLFAVVPPLDAEGRVDVAALQLRDWLGGDASPLAAWHRDGIVPPLLVDLRTSPPIEDDTARRAAAAKYARAATDWADARSAAGEATRVDAARGALPLLVHVGSRGVHAELPSPDGSSVRWGAPFASRLGLLPALVVVVLALATRRLLLALFAGGLTGAIAWVATATPGVEVGVFEALAGGVAHFVAGALGPARHEPAQLLLLPGAVLFAVAIALLAPRVPAFSSRRARTMLAWCVEAGVPAAAILLAPTTPAAAFSYHGALAAVLVLAATTANTGSDRIAAASISLRAVALLLLTWTVQRVSGDLGAGAFLAVVC